MDPHGPIAGLPRLALGGAALGGLYTPVDDHAATEVVDLALLRGLTYIDTTPLYGHGVSEARIGRALRRADRTTFTISTKVGRLVDPASADERDIDMFADAPPTRIVRDYSAAAVLRSIESSIQRLGVSHLDIVYVHDPEDHMEQALAETVPTLLKLRDEGVIGAVGVGTNQVDVPERFIREGDVDVVLLARRWTLLDRTAQSLLDRCATRGVPVVLGGIMNLGLLADPEHNQTFDYVPAPPHLIRAAQAMRKACQRRQAPLSTAAIQHGFRHPAVRSVLVGCRSAGEVEAAAQSSAGEIDDDLWAELDQHAVTLGNTGSRS